MKSKAITQILLVILSITTCVLSFQSPQDYFSQLRYLGNRNLQDGKFNKTQMDLFCTKANITGYAKIALDYVNSTVVDQTNAAYAKGVEAFSYDPAKNKESEKLVQFLKGDGADQQLLQDYLVGRVTPLVIFLIFGVFSLITWIIYFFCCCCPSCCCSQKGCCCQGETCPNIAFMISIVSFVAIIACCICGFVFSAAFTDGTNSVTCRFMTFYYNTESGQNVTETPRWIGISGIKNTLAETTAALDEISKNSKTAFNNSTWTETEPQQFKNNLTNVYNLFSKRTLINTNPAPSLRKVAVVTPIYISNLGDYEKKDTLLNTIFQEFDLRISASITMIEQAKGYSKDIDKYSEPIKSSLNSVSTSLSPIEDAFKNINTDVIKPWADVQNGINDNAVNGSLALFSLIAAISALCIVFLIMYACCCKIQIFRFCLHLFWICLGLLTFIFFIVGVVFGAVGLIGKDGVSVINYVFSNENLSLKPQPKILANAQAGEYLNVCLNGDGDLATKILGNELQGTTGVLDKLYNVSNTLIETKKTITDNKNSIAITKINENLNTLKVDFPGVTPTSYGSDAMINQFIEYNKWTDYNTPSGFQKGCSTNSKDFWSTNLAQCADGYVKVDAGAVGAGDPNCLIFNEWSAGQFAARYTPRPEGCSTTTGSPDFTNVQTAAGAYYTSFNTFSSENVKLINQLEAETNTLNGAFSSMSNKLLDLLASVDGIILPLVAIFNKYVGKAGIFQLVNCKYMGTDIRALLKVLSNDLADSAQNTYAAIIAAALFLYLGTMCMFIVILRKRAKPEGAQNVPGDVEMGQQKS